MKKVNKVLNIISVLYLIVPLIIFYFGWLKIYYAIPLSLLTIYFGYKLVNNFKEVDIKEDKKKIIIYWIVTIALIVLWVFLSGIGGYSYQRYDYMARNPMFNDLNNYKWPIIYDYSAASSEVQQYMGNTSAMLVYYFVWWLPVSLIVKLFHLNNILSNLLLFIYSVLGLFLLVYNLTKYFKKYSYLIILVLMLFSGLDILMWNGEVVSQIEWWISYFQYSSHTSLLFSCFNQAIPIWLIISVLLRQKDDKLSLALCSIVLAYSPWAAIGILPFMVYIVYKNRKDIKSLFTISNILVPISMLIFVLFYLSKKGTTEISLFITSYFSQVGINNDSIFVLFSNILILQILFIIMECGVYLIFCRKIKKDLPFYYIVLFELIMCPFITSSPHGNNFTMRVSVCALFLLSIYVITYLLNNKISFNKKIMLSVIFAIGALNPIIEFKESMSNRYKVFDPLYSFYEIDIKDDNGSLIEIAKDQFINYEYDDSIFYKYFGRR